MKIRADRKGSHSARNIQGIHHWMSQKFSQELETGAEIFKECEVISSDTQRTEYRSLERKENLKLIIKIQRRLLTDSQ